MDNQASPRNSGVTAFGQRLQEACDANEAVPARNRGRLKWLVEQLASQGIRISVETARRWVSGETRPRPDKTTVLAEVLGVSEAWLALGEVEPERPVAATGRFSENPLVNLAIGLIQLEGGSCALPEEGDGVDLYAIINGRKLDLCFARGEEGKDRTVTFHTSNVDRGFRVIGGLFRSPGIVDFYDLTGQVGARTQGRGDGATDLVGELQLESLVIDGRHQKRLGKFAELSAR